ncbi:ThuA domain-containing protein [Bacillus sp. REN16]|uniref:ThuA domain-containing protein n=1 Tax=Bacillus sp. REN16 TaxID=2887296 RepID=UPI001E42EA1D|nr:ThuA domain-containing protein [Bacillus sp. REN16]MCC3359138.1 ThuA domain-containing protein [Bacillus sp. REN16]
MKKIIALLGDHYHDKRLLQKSLMKAMEKLKLESGVLRIEYIEVEQLAEKLQEKPDAVILSKQNKRNPTAENVEYWMDEKLEKQICEYVHSGGGWLVWHSGLSSYEVREDYYSMVKGKFDFHPSELLDVAYQWNNTDDNLRILDAAYNVRDEHYFVTCEERKTNVFLHAISEKGKTVAGWKHEYGKGRVICLTPSHTEEGLLHDEFTNLLFSSLTWCCGKLA